MYRKKRPAHHATSVTICVQAAKEYHLPPKLQCAALHVNVRMSGICKCLECLWQPGILQDAAGLSCRRHVMPSNTNAW